jgi:FtsZ-interacting cell division protein YlmF
MWDKLKELFSVHEDDIPVESGMQTLEVPVRGENGGNIVSLRPGTDYSHEVVVMHPKSFSDTMLAVRYLKNRCAVVVNVSTMEEEESQRFVDFVSGSAFALDGAQERIGEGIFILTPSHISLRSGQAPVTEHGVVARG